MSDILMICEQQYDAKTVQFLPSDWNKYFTGWNSTSTSAQDWATSGMIRHMNGQTAVAADCHATRLKMPLCQTLAPATGFGDLGDIYGDPTDSQWQAAPRTQLYVREANSDLGF